jgi:hypothetical protein
MEARSSPRRLSGRFTALERQRRRQSLADIPQAPAPTQDARVLADQAVDAAMAALTMQHWEDAEQGLHRSPPSAQT